MRGRSGGLGNHVLTPKGGLSAAEYLARSRRGAELRNGPCAVRLNSLPMLPYSRFCGSHPACLADPPAAPAMLSARTLFRSAGGTAPFNTWVCPGDPKTALQRGNNR